MLTPFLFFKSMLNIDGILCNKSIKFEEMENINQRKEFFIEADFLRTKIIMFVIGLYDEV